MFRARAMTLARAAHLVHESLEPRRLLAAITWDGGGDGVNWSSQNNWSNNQLPTANDDVTISLASTAQVVLSTNASVKSLISNRPFAQTGGTLSATNGTTLHNNFDWSGGTHTGAVLCSEGTVVNITGNAIKRINDSLLVYGETNYTGTNLQLSTANIANNGTFNAINSGNISAFGAGTNTFINNGTFEKTGITNMKFEAVSLNNAGIFKPNTQGSVELQGGISTQPIMVSAGGKLLFSKGTFVIDGPGVMLSGFGDITLADTDGTAKISLAVSTAILENLKFNGGTIEAGVGHLLTLGGTFDWTAGTIYHNIVIDSGTTANLSGTGIKLINDTVLNSGTINYTGTNFQFASATITNFATFNVSGAGDIVSAGGFGNTINNIGTLTRSGAGTVHFTDVPINNTGTFNVNQGGLVLTSGSTVKPLFGTGTLTIADGASLATSAMIQNNANVSGVLTLNGSNVRSTVKSLVFADNGSLDVGSNAMVVDYDGASPIATLQPKVTSGRNNGAWNGIGIRSTNAASDPTTAVGFGEATAIGSPATFMNESLDQTSLIFRHTKLGDANLSHNVDFNDLLTLAQNYGQTGRNWSQGNFDFSADGSVNFSDLLILAQRYGQSASTTSERTIGGSILKSSPTTPPGTRAAGLR